METGPIISFLKRLGRKLPYAVAYFHFLTCLTHQLAFLAPVVIKVSSRLLTTTCVTSPTSPLKITFFCCLLALFVTQPLRLKKPLYHKKGSPSFWSCRARGWSVSCAHRPSIKADFPGLCLLQDFLPPDPLSQLFKTLIWSGS